MKQIFILYFNTSPLKPEDIQIINSLKSGGKERVQSEQLLYTTYYYFIDEGSRKFNLNSDDSFSAYSDAVLSTILNVVSGSFDGRSSLKTYLFQIFSNKCIDLVRKNTTNKQQVHKTMPVPELLSQLPDAARNIVEKLITNEKRKALAESLEKIGEKCREMLLLFEDGYSDKEIAEQLAYNNAAVAKTTRLRCLEKLKEKMQAAVKQL